ncbi:hypothetical protein [Nocardiopsis trehalosi]
MRDDWGVVATAAEDRNSIDLGADIAGGLWQRPATTAEDRNTPVTS